MLLRQTGNGKCSVGCGGGEGVEDESTKGGVLQLQKVEIGGGGTRWKVIKVLKAEVFVESVQIEGAENPTNKLRR